MVKNIFLIITAFTYATSAMERQVPDPFIYKDEQTVIDQRTIAILAYGSLVNNPDPGDRPALKASPFAPAGIKFPVALSRESRGSRITLVIDGKLGEPKDLYYATSTFRFLPNARNNLAGREGVPFRNDGYNLDNIFYMKKIINDRRPDLNEKPIPGTQWIIRMSNPRVELSTQKAQELANWADRKGFTALVWASFPPTYDSLSDVATTLINDQTILRNTQQYISELPGGAQTPFEQAVMSGRNALLQYAQRESEPHRQNNYSDEVKSIVAEAKRLGKISQSASITGVVMYGGRNTPIVVFIRDGNAEKVLKYAEFERRVNSDQLRADITFVNNLNRMAQASGVIIPKLIVPSDAFVLTTRKGGNISKHVISIEEKAKGKELNKIILHKLDDQELINMFFSIGKQYGALDKLMITTHRALLFHNDSQLRNLMYDSQTKRLTWIDIVRIAMDYRTSPSPEKDSFFETELGMVLRNGVPVYFKDQMDNLPTIDRDAQKEIYIPKFMLALNSFAKGYLESYPENKAHIKQVIHNSDAYRNYIRFNRH
ncbi:MAG TPA: hypothetical protein VNJ29_03190 [Candidatus Nitrosotenuis sp.]|nr:hypothetical protein [Candidatus Nitrosotenuis sp.]